VYLAQLNIGKLRGGKDDPRMADFFGNLDHVNALAERMPGFVWRYKDASGSAIDTPWLGDPTMAVNMSVWENIQVLEKFVWQTIHTKIYARKHEFFETPTKPILVMWWIPEGHIPTLEEAKDRLDRYIAHGPSEYAFGWAEVPAAKLWREKRCA
jgi:hypothetical protein